ncbi:MAG TPA: SMI1/KNR4 family protein [Gemmataceae bacterium]|nr:SMI1/KNR4 family protein [Gemmataceae bacterium]
MTEADVASIESELRVTLPSHYREFVLNYPNALREAKFEYNQESAAQSLLFDDPQLVIDLNQGVRKLGLFLADGETEPWPDKYLIIGADGGGNYWCIIRGGRSKAVWFFEHEEGVFERSSKSLEDHAKYAQEFIEAFNRGEG